MELSVGEIRVPENLMRREMSEKGLEHLARSMKEVGLIHPIGIKVVSEGWELVHGARRLAAAKMLEWDKIEVRQVGQGGDITEIIKVMENREREDVSAIDEGAYYKTLLMDKGWTQAHLAEMLQVSAGFISQRINSLEWPKSLREAVTNGVLSFSTAREIAGIKDYEHLLYIVVHAAKNGATPSIAREWRIRANLDYAARLRAEASTEDTAGSAPQPEPLINCHPCDRKVPVGESSTFTVCTECRELIEEVRNQGLFWENIEREGVSWKEAV